jgi:3-oxoadipate enol-lactonase
MSVAIAADGTRLHYSVTGRHDGEPVLMIQGLGADSRGWLRQRRAFAAHHRVIVFDNRGVGRSDKPTGTYDLEVMALDALAVLDAAGFESAHVVGASMGGILSQIIGVRNPERVRSLTLACTACRHHEWRRELLHEWAAVAERDGMSAFSSTAVRWLIGPRSLRRFWPLVGGVGSLAMQLPPECFVAQVRAILAMSDELRAELCTIALPTLVLVGSQDILTPLGDSEELAELIPGAELAVIGGGAHGFMFEHAPAFNKTVLDFLGRVSAASTQVSAADASTATS